MRDELTAGLSRLVAQIDPAAAAMPADPQPLPDPRYATPFTGIYWQVEDLSSIAKTLAGARGGTWRRSRVRGPTAPGEQVPRFPVPTGSRCRRWSEVHPVPDGDRSSVVPHHRGGGPGLPRPVDPPLRQGGSQSALADTRRDADPRRVAAGARGPEAAGAAARGIEAIRRVAGESDARRATRAR